MATTSPATAAHLLDVLDRAGVTYAMLHNEAAMAEGDVTSDLDLVVDRPARAVMLRLHGELQSANLFVIARFPYDVSATSYFITDATAEQGVQLDLMHDPQGHGRLGVKSSAVLGEAKVGQRYPRLSDVDELLYLLVKRNMKGDDERLAKLLERARTLGSPVIKARAEIALSSASAHCVADLLEGGRPSRRASHGRGFVLRSAVRVAGRVLRPVGFWVDISGAAATDVGAGLAKRFSRILPEAVVHDRPAVAPAEWIWRATKVTPAILRPALVVSTGHAASRARPNLALPVDSLDVEDAARRCVAAMSRRTATDLGLPPW